MDIQRLSIKTLVVGVLLVLGLIPVSYTIIAKTHFRDAALKAQVNSVLKVVEVATREVLHRLEVQLIEAANHIQARPELRAAYRFARSGSAGSLHSALDDPLVNGFAGTHLLDLVKLRAYDIAYLPVAESPAGLQHLPFELPPEIGTLVNSREGADKYKAAGSLWHASSGPLYSVLVPLGGLHAEGYLELVADPLYNLTRVADMVQLPMLIRSEGRRLYATPGLNEADARYVPVPYRLFGPDAPAYELVVFTDVGTLHADLARTQVGINAVFFALTALTLASALWLLGRFVIAPILNLADDMERCRCGELCASSDDRSLKEISVLVRNFRELTLELRSRTEKLERLSTHDSLTGIANRRQFDTVLQREWKRAQRTGNELSLLLLDVDSFKRFNDSQGHQAGDECLREIAGAIATAVSRPGDLVARYGGEEFAIVLPDTPAAGAMRTAEWAMDNIARLAIPHPASSVARVVTISVGIATLQPNPSTDPDKLIAAADEALYRAKSCGRNRIEQSRRSTS